MHIGLRCLELQAVLWLSEMGTVPIAVINCSISSGMHSLLCLVILSQMV